MGVTGFATLALLKSELDGVRDEATNRALQFLRTLPDERATRAHEIALVIMALVTAGDPQDSATISRLAVKLASQRQRGEAEADRSASQIALLGLRAAAYDGSPTPPAVWQDTATAWRRLQGADGGWMDIVGPTSDWKPGRSRASPTLTGLSTLLLCRHMARGTLKSPGFRSEPLGDPQFFDAVNAARAWAANHGGSQGKEQVVDESILFHVYGLERSLRHRGELFVGENRWRHDAAAVLLRKQVTDLRYAHWTGNNNVIATSLAMIFLADVAAPSMISRLDLAALDGPTSSDPGDEIWRLSEFVARQRHWPLLVTGGEWRFGNAAHAVRAKRAPLLMVTGPAVPQLGKEQEDELRDFVSAGGTIVSFGTGERPHLKHSLEALLKRITGPSGGPLRPLPQQHPYFRSEYDLSAAPPAVDGFDSGCRTVALLFEDDFPDLWSRGASASDGKGAAGDAQRRAFEAGANAVVYALGSLPHHPYSVPQLSRSVPEPAAAETRALQLAQVRHSGSGVVAPHALEAVVGALKRGGKATMAERSRVVALRDPDMFQYPVLFLHGRTAITLDEAEKLALQRHLRNGGLLFADACCSSREFDSSFRRLIRELFPEGALEPVPIDDPIYSSQVGSDLRPLFRSDDAEKPSLLEGVRLGGRLRVVYSARDISCALELGPSHHCRHYAASDAVRIAGNVVLYALY